MGVALSEIAALNALNPDIPDKEKQKQVGAAQDFEALLIGQMLHSLREEESGWLGTGDDDAGAVAFGFGEDQLAKAIAKGGGLGLSKIIAAGLAAKSTAAESATAGQSALAGKSQIESQALTACRAAIGLGCAD